MNNVEQFLNEVEAFDCGLTKIRIGNEYDGGYVLLEELCERTDIIFSLGVGDDVGFELDFAEKFPGVQRIHLIDHTINTLPEKHPKFFFHEENARNVCERLDPMGNTLLKMDIEWCEWDILDRLKHSILNEFSQMVVEFHVIHAQTKKGLTPHFHSLYDYALEEINDRVFEEYLEVIKKLNGLFYTFHIHANNSLPKVKMNGVQFPPLIELSFVRQDLVNRAIPTKKHFPIKGLDFPNKTDRPDIKDVYPLGV